jgi:hypothetical protein
VVRRFDRDPHVTPFLKALNTLRREATRQRAFTEHVATIIAMVDQYAESAMGDRHYFCEQPYVLHPEAAAMRSPRDGNHEWIAQLDGLGAKGRQLVEIRVWSFARSRLQTYFLKRVFGGNM